MLALTQNPGENVAFEGVRLRLAIDSLTEEAFEVIPAGGNIEATFDIAELHDLSEGGAFDVLSEGAISYADLDSTKIAGVATFSSNLLSAQEIDGAEAAKVRSAFLQKRTAVQSDCTGTRRTATVNAITRCRSLAQAAASQAQSNSARVNEYFKSTSSSTRSQVANVFSRVASECGSTTGGNSRYFCSDVYGACSSGVLAYTLPSASYMVNCPLFFSGLSATSGSCHAQDQQTTILHEVTHLTSVAGTSDLNGYGYSYVRSLSASQSLRHADTYTLFAQCKSRLPT